MEAKKMVSRRKFIQSMLVAGSSLMLPGTIQAYEQGEEIATLLDLSKCVGCGACVDACKETNAHKFPRPKKPFPKMYPKRVKVSDWSDKQDVDDRLTPIIGFLFKLLVVCGKVKSLRLISLGVVCIV